MRRLAVSLPLLASIAVVAAACGGSPGVSSGDNLAEGKALFLNTPSRGEMEFPSCATCHQLADAQDSMTRIGPNLDDAFRTPRREGFAESTFEQVVRGQIEIPGVPSDAAIISRTAMPSRDDWGLTEEEADNIAAYVANCAGLSDKPEDAADCPPTPPMPQAANGEVTGEGVFASAGCGTCHILQAAGTTGTIGPNLDESAPGVDLVVDRVTNGAGAMPSFRDQLSEEQIQAVAEFVASSAGQ